MKETNKVALIKMEIFGSAKYIVKRMRRQAID